LKGHGFTADLNNDLSSSWGGGGLSSIIGPYDTSTGVFTATFTVPTGSFGAHTVTFLEINGDDELTTTASASFTIGAIVSTPEYPLGALIGLIACFLGFAIFAKRKSFPTIKTHF
jgi:hypothetical protein